MTDTLCRRGAPYPQALTIAASMHDAAVRELAETRIARATAEAKLDDAQRELEALKARLSEVERERDEANAQAMVARNAYDEARALDGHKLCRAEHFAAMQLVTEWSQIADTERAARLAAEERVRVYHALLRETLIEFRLLREKDDAGPYDPTLIARINAALSSSPPAPTEPPAPAFMQAVHQAQRLAVDHGLSSTVVTEPAAPSGTCEALMGGPITGLGICGNPLPCERHSAKKGGA